jgi:hypothetical protein
MTGSTIVAASALLAALAATPAFAQEGAADSAAAAADTVPADTAAAVSLLADSLPADSADAASGGEHGIPSLEGFRKIAILYRDMAPGVPGYETAVEVHRGPEGAQVLRFTTRATPWAFVVSGGAASYTLRDFDCSGGYTEELEAGTPLVIPDCAMPEAPAPAPAPDDDD